MCKDMPFMHHDTVSNQCITSTFMESLSERNRSYVVTHRDISVRGIFHH